MLSQRWEEQGFLRSREAAQSSEKKKKRKEKSINLMRSQVLYRAAQEHNHLQISQQTAAAAAASRGT